MWRPSGRLAEHGSPIRSGRQWRRRSAAPDGITIHLREDRRHIQDHDVRRLTELVHIKLNLEMAATAEMIDLAVQCKPQMVMLVPEGRQEITTEGGLDVVGNRSGLTEAVAQLRDAGLSVSAFIDAEPDQVDAAAQCGFSVCEIHTGPYAHVFHDTGHDAEHPKVQAELDRIAAAGHRIRSAGMRFNAGHALNYYNVQPIAALTGIRELHIGHSIVARAMYVGIRTAVTEMKRLMRESAVQERPDAR